MKKTFWGDYNKTSFPKLEKDVETKYLIIGGGITGLSAAYFLLEKGETDITLVEGYTVGSGSTGHSAGMLVSEPESASWSKIAHVYGTKAAKDYYNAQIEVTETMISIIKKNSISCDYSPHYLIMLGNNLRARNHILEDFITRKKIGAAAKILEKNSAYAINKNFTTAEKIPGNISVNSLLFAKGLATHLKKRGVLIYEHTKVSELKNHITNTPKGRIKYETLIECRGVQDRKTPINTFLTTVAITRKLTALEMKSLSLEKRYMFIDDEKRSFHYGKLTPDNRLLIGYGDVLKKDIKDEDLIHIPHKKNIERFLKKIFPEVDLNVFSIWSHRYALSKTILPNVSISKNHAVINGAGTQVLSMVCAQYAVSQLLKEKHVLRKIFASKKSCLD